MKTSFNTILRSGVAAIALTLVSSAAMAITNGQTGTLHSNGADAIYDVVSTSATGSMGGGGWLVPAAWNVTFGGETFYAFCIDPMVAMSNRSGVVYTANTGFVPSAGVKRLYETSYASSLSDTTHAAAFQLALWELNNDNATGFSSGNLIIDDQSQSAVVLADQMMHATTVTGQYHYTSLISNTNYYGRFTSQNLLTVSAVPEADTYAMLLAGLGLIGFMRRRKAA